MAATTPAVTGPMAACLQQLDGLPPPDLDLPALEPVKNRDTYRTRPENELEEATWYSADEPNTLVEPAKIRLRSIHSKQATVISFTNKSAFRVRALWIDFSGNEVVYSVLEPNTTRRYHTYQTHPWIVRELHSGTRMMLSGRPAVVGLSTEQTVEISAPPQLQWSLDTFSCFPESYKASVQGLLLSHKHLEVYATQSSLCEFGLPLQPLKTPPCSPAPCSPRATLTHQGALPTSPKAPRLTTGPHGMSPLSTAGCHTPRTPRVAAAVAGSPAGSSEVSAGATTSISISSEASHFKATLTVSSPARQQTVNIEVFNNPAGSMAGTAATTVNFDTQLGSFAGSSTDSRTVIEHSPGAAHSAAVATSSRNITTTTNTTTSSSSRSSTTGRKAAKAKHGLFNNLVHSFKHAFRPGLRQLPVCLSTPSPPPASSQGAPSTSTHITLHLRQLLQGAISEPDIMNLDDEAEELSGVSVAAPWPPVGTHLGHLPSHLLVAIAELAAPQAWQTLDQCPKGRPDIQPTLLACPPKTAEEVAAEEQQQQQQQQQAENGAEQQDDMPALI